MQGDKLLVGCFFFMAVVVEAQSFSATTLEGRVYSMEGDVAATHVLNTTTGKATITDSNGLFSIRVRLQDTLVFSAVQFKRKEIVVTMEVLLQKTIYVPLEDALTELDEVIVRPYSLSGDMELDAKSLVIGPVVTAATLGLPNAYVGVPTKAERQLFEATSGGGLIPLNPILNAISGRTKMLKNQVRYEEQYARTTRVRGFYADSLYVQELKIPEIKIDDFMYFCEVDPVFQAVVDSRDRLKLWEYMVRKSAIYRENNGLD